MGGDGVNAAAPGRLIRAIARAELPGQVNERMRVQVMPWGTFDSNTPEGDTVTTVVDERAVALMNAAFDQLHRSRKVDMLFDFEHQSEGGPFKRADGLAPAAGWIRHDGPGFVGVPGDGVYVDVDWTPPARELIANRQYRYPSFVGYLRESDGLVVAVKSVGLVNEPANPVRPVVNKQAQTRKEFAMKSVLAKLGLPETADETAVVEAINKLQESAKPKTPEIKTTLCKTLKLAEDAKDDDVVQAVNKLAEAKPAASASPGEESLRAELTTVKNALAESNKTLASLQASSVERDVEERIQTALKERKLCEGMLVVNADGKNFYRELARDQKAWDLWYASAAKVAPEDGRVVTNSRTSSPAGRITVINKAKGEFRENAKIIPCSERQYVDQLLREQGETKLSDEEVKTHSLAG